MGNTEPPEKLLTPAEVAERFAVDPKTVTRWAQHGLLPSIKTPGGHRRYRKSVVDAMAVETFERDQPVSPAAD
jgi:excisionase family DNA binding protein